ncbi:phage tail assembly protein [Sphingomonas hengshuiensis]|uniref:Uncharacterized protein n=1 Tax=Sphingomonas hengshuiensis TaxID=1609977 RepID=A0A7U4LGH0_9SPHN|nr:phage tail assembly protein [Sphingomonas hengshuiensis]AJP73169.1 hypothetical protein TS85_17290 [Sphingomonas hengshuiensis]
MAATVYPLKHPIIVTIGERTEEITSLALRRATGNDLLLIDSFRHQPMKLVLEMIAALSGQPFVIIQKLDAGDVGPLGELAFANVEDGLPIGGTS